jgi:hypothetical protein
MKLIAFWLTVAWAFACGGIIALFAIWLVYGGDNRTADQKFGCSQQQTNIASGECK